MSLQQRRDYTYGYTYTTEGEGDALAADAAYDARKKGTVYATVYDEDGNDAVVQITSIGDTVAGTPGWGASGPARTNHVLALHPDNASWCGTGITGKGYCTQSHPGGASTPGWDPVEQTAHGWRDAGGYRGVALDATAHNYSHVYGALNMWKNSTVHTGDDPYDYKFRIFRWEGAEGALAQNASYTYADNSEGWMVDAMAVNAANGTLVYKATPRDVNTRSRVGVLRVEGGALVSVLSEELAPSSLLSMCGASCVDRRDAFRFTDATYGKDNNDVDVVIFVGSSRVNSSASSFEYYPSIFKVKFPADTVNVSGGGVDGDEMYFNGGRVPQECEGQQAAPTQTQGRFSTFKSVVVNGQYGYVGTAAAGCTNCTKRAGCIWMFSLDFSDNASSTDELVVLSGGDTDGLGEVDVHRMTVASDGTSNGGFLYALTGASTSAAARIVKIEIGGPNTLSTCTSGCFRRVASYAAAKPVRAMVYAPDFTALFTASYTESTTTYTRYATAEVTSLSPKYGPATGAATEVTVTGSGFPTTTISAGGNKSHAAACRFGTTDEFPKEGWVPATVVSSTEVHCVAPAAIQASVITSEGATGPTISGVAEFELSFDGYPADPANDSLDLFNRSLWTKDGAVYRYYATPGVASVLSNGVAPPAMMITGVAADQTAAIITLIGGPFVNTSSLVCRFHADPGSDQTATYISATQITCPVCQTQPVGNETQCHPYGSQNTTYAYNHMSWLPDNSPRDVTVAFSLNGVDFHNASRTLAIFGQPHHLEVTHLRTAGQYFYGSTNDSMGYMTLDPMEMKVADVNGYVMQNDYGTNDDGTGGTLGFFKVKIELDTTASPVSSPVATLIPGSDSTNTTNGMATLSPKFSRPLMRGDYYLNFKLQHCTSDIDCGDMPGITTLVITVIPGIATQILVRPGYVSSSNVDVGLSTADAIVKPASRTVELGAIFVDVLDAGDNLVVGHDSSTHVINVTSTMTNGVGGYEERSTGATLVGNTSIGTVKGIAEFRDLQLVSQEPTGERIPGQTSTLAFGSPSRGVNGTDKLYWLQFTSQLPGLTSSVHAFSFSHLEITPGVAAYLNITNYTDVSVTCNNPEESISIKITVNVFDGGNNMLEADSAHRTVTVQSYGEPALNMSGTTAVADLSGEAKWEFPAASIKLSCETVGSYGLQFTSPTVTPTIQVIKMVQGLAYQWRVVQIGQWTNLPASVLVPIGVFRLEVLDGGGNLIGDKDVDTNGNIIYRRAQCSSGTAGLANMTSTETFGSGVANVTLLTMVRPAVGSHVITCLEYEREINGVTTQQASANGFTPLAGGEFTVTVVPGEREALQIQIVTAGTDPKVDYSVSLGDVDTHTFRHYASADRIVPLDTFRIRPIDFDGNVVSGDLPAFNVSTTNSTVTHTRRFVSALLPGVSTSGQFPHTTGNNVRLSRGAVLVGNFRRLQTADKTGTTVEMLGDSNEASMEALALRMPPHGTFNLTFTTTPLDPKLTDVSIQITVQPGRAHHIGLAAPCTNKYPLVSCDASSTLDDGSGLPCTCAVYNVSRIVVLSPLRAYVLDGGENALGSSHAPVCEIGAATCTGQTITLQHESSKSGMCVLEALTGTAMPPSSPADPDCAQTQPATFTGITVDGEHEFSNLALVAPTQADPSDPFMLSFHSPGLIGVDFGLEIRPGVAVKLGLVLSPNFPSNFTSGVSTDISTSAYPIIVQVLDVGGSPVGDYDTHSRQVRLEVTDPNGGVGVVETVATLRDIASFDSIRLPSPANGNHVLMFSTLNLESVSLDVTVVAGEPAGFVAGTEPLDAGEYDAEPVVTLEPITMEVIDAGGNVVGSANYVSKPVFVNITGGPVKSDGTPAYSQVMENGENVEMLQPGLGSVTFSSIKVRAPLMGTYNMTFSGDGISGVPGTFKVLLGAPYKLNVPATHTMVGDPHFLLLAVLTPQYAISNETVI